MNEVNLTKDAEAVIKKLNSQYRKRINAGISKTDAADFGSSKHIHKDFFPDWTFEDIDYACMELLRANLLDGLRADGYLYTARLSDKGIAFSQHHASKSASTTFGYVLELLQAIRSLLPW